MRPLGHVKEIHLVGAFRGPFTQIVSRKPEKSPRGRHSAEGTAGKYLAHSKGQEASRTPQVFCSAEAPSPTPIFSYGPTISLDTGSQAVLVCCSPPGQRPCSMGLALRSLNQVRLSTPPLTDGVTAGTLFPLHPLARKWT